MRLFALGLNHRTAPIDIRERIAFPADAQRTEVYLRAANDEALGRASNWLNGLPNVAANSLSPHLYSLADSALPRYAARVSHGQRA